MDGRTDRHLLEARTCVPSEVVCVFLSLRQCLSPGTWSQPLDGRAGSTPSVLRSSQGASESLSTRQPQRFCDIAWFVFFLVCSFLFNSFTFSPWWGLAWIMNATDSAFHLPQTRWWLVLPWWRASMWSLTELGRGWALRPAPVQVSDAWIGQGALTRAPDVR